MKNQGVGAEPARGASSAPAAPLLSAVYAGFDPDHYRWWDRVACHRGETARGFDFHAMGLPHGEHVIAKAKVSRAQSKSIGGELFRTETGVPV